MKKKNPVTPTEQSIQNISGNLDKVYPSEEEQFIFLHTEQQMIERSMDDFDEVERLERFELYYGR